ncbi:MAG: response regulator [Myxococcales bacterium]|nr:response regulator [Myxococcales bacterium]
MSRGRTPPVKDTYSTHDVAKICCVTPTTVIRWIEDGLIPAFKTVGGHRRVRREDLEKVCSERGIPFNVQSGDETGRILVVDDEPVVLDLVRDVVNDITHSFEVEVARDAFDAGRLVAVFRPQLIFLDLMMPGVDGFEVCTRLKRDSATAHTEIVAITGYYTEANTERILSAGAVACLRKPLDVTDVRRRVIESFRLREEQVSGHEESLPAENAKVLLVTQNADFRAKVQDELSEAAVKVLTAQTAGDALLVAQAAPPKYVILSLSLPDLDDSKLIEKLIKGTSHPPTIIAVHDDPSEAMREAVQAAGVRMCLPTKAVTGNVRGLLGV